MTKRKRKGTRQGDEKGKEIAHVNGEMIIFPLLTNFQMAIAPC